MSTHSTPIGAFPNPPHRTHQAHEPMSELFSYDMLAARAQALHEVTSGVYTWSEARSEAQRCAHEANSIAEHYQWPSIDLDTIAPSQILNALPPAPVDETPMESTAGRDMNDEQRPGKHRRNEARPSTPDPDPVPTGETTGALQYPRSMEDTQLIRQVSPLAG